MPSTEHRKPTVSPHGFWRLVGIGQPERDASAMPCRTGASQISESLAITSPSKEGPATLVSAACDQANPVNASHKGVRCQRQFDRLIQQSLSLRQTPLNGGIADIE
jgi:hypothetical protein